MSNIPKTVFLFKPPEDSFSLSPEIGEGVVVCRPKWMLEGTAPLFSFLGRWELLTSAKRKDHNHYLSPWQNLWRIETTLFGNDSPELPGLRFCVGWENNYCRKERFLDQIKEKFPQDFLWLTLHPEVFRGHYQEEEEFYEEEVCDEDFGD